MKVILVDPSASSKDKIRHITHCRGEQKLHKKTEVHHGLMGNDGEKTAVPMVFHNVHANRISEGMKLSEYYSLSDAFNDNGRREMHGQITDDSLVQQQPTFKNQLVIKTDPKYNNGNKDILVSNKKLDQAVDYRSKKITFISSLPSGVSLPILATENLLRRTHSTHLTQNNTSSSHLTHRSQVIHAKNRECGPGIEEERNESKKVVDSHRATSPPYQNNRERSNPGTVKGEVIVPNLTGKFSLDLRLKLNKNKLQSLQGYSTCTFRVKVKSRSKF